ncbi:MAG: dihydropteroate synthase [Halocynthiibacter sp.]
MTTKKTREKFVVIGENIHTTRIKLRKGKHVTLNDRGDEEILFTPANAVPQHLPISEKFRNTQDFEEGRVKHVKIAVDLAMFSSGAQADIGMAYLRDMVEKQQSNGANYLDLNVDEFSLKPSEQVDAMKWLVATIERFATVPVCIDSSSAAVIEAGLSACTAPVGPVMLNSASLERPEALDIARAHGAVVVVTAAGGTAMPDGASERIENAIKIVDMALAKGFALDQLYVDPLVFPVSVNSAFAMHCLDAIRAIRQKYGPEIRITGGFSNVSFGIPLRKHINDTFLRAAVEAGADSGIIDPVMNNPASIFAKEDDSLAVQLATDVITGNDPDCRAYIKAWRRKRI